MSAALTMKEIRTSGHSRTSIAVAAGVPTTTVTRIETGASDATIGMMENLAAAAGLHLQIVLRRVATLADASDISPDGDGESWFRLRLAAQTATDTATAKAVITPAPRTEDVWALNVLAGVAERIAHQTGLPIPMWCARIKPLSATWTPSGTPRMVQRSIDTAPKELLDRGIGLGVESVWSEG